MINVSQLSIIIFSQISKKKFRDAQWYVRVEEENLCE